MTKKEIRWIHYIYSIHLLQWRVLRIITPNKISVEESEVEKSSIHQIRKKYWYQKKRGHLTRSPCPPGVFSRVVRPFQPGPVHSPLAIFQTPRLLIQRYLYPVDRAVFVFNCYPLDSDFKRRGKPNYTSLSCSFDWLTLNLFVIDWGKRGGIVPKHQRLMQSDLDYFAIGQEGSWKTFTAE